MQHDFTKKLSKYVSVNLDHISLRPYLFVFVYLLQMKQARIEPQPHPGLYFYFVSLFGLIFMKHKGQLLMCRKD